MNEVIVKSEIVCQDNNVSFEEIKKISSVLNARDQFKMGSEEMLSVDAIDPPSFQRSSEAKKFRWKQRRKRRQKKARV
jgi:hypothetical protein